MVASLLAKSALGGHHQWYQWATVALGVVGGLVLLAGALAILLPREFGFSVNAREAAMVM